MKMSAPGTSQSYSVADGTTFSPGLDGTLDVPANYVAQLTQLGWSLAPDAACDTTANRPATANPGDMFFDSTLGIPIWRNAANSAWVNASGSTV